MINIHHGDCLGILRAMPDNSVDSIVTDPPYGLSFMGKKWDYDVPAVKVWAECLRVLKPGGHLLAFAGTRTQHRMAVRIEDAGFEIRDMIAWVYGSGFPKSRNLDGDWQGWGTALKPALEPITVARKPLAGTVAENVLRHGTGGLNIDGCRVGSEGGTAKANIRKGEPNGDRAGTSMGEKISFRCDIAKLDAGRWPANLIHDGSDEVLAGFPSNEGRFFFECKGDNGACQSLSHLPSGAPTAQPSLSLQSALAATVQSAVATWPSLAGILSEDSTGLSTSATPSESRLISEAVTTAILPIAFESSRESQLEKHSPCGSRVSVAVAKSQTGTTTITASLWRSDGCAGSATFSITPTSLDRGGADLRFRYCAKASRSDRGAGNTHPTVKPTDLMRYLCRLVTPPRGVVLDPFMGSGSTGKAAVLEGFRFIGCEMNSDYIEIARARIHAAHDAISASTDVQRDLF